MASYSRSETPEFTTCSICLETFKCPKSLPCLHSFCKACIAKYFTTVTNKGQGQSDPIECPVCRKEVEKPTNIGTPEEWADQLPTNHLLVSIMDMSSVTEKTKVCACCQMENKTESATTWCIKCKKALCETCERRHAMFTNNAKHKIVSVQDVDKVDPQLFGCNIPCPRHPEKKIEAFCFDHNSPCCVSCVMINHRKCDKVENADTAANEFRNSNIYEEMKKDFESIRIKMGELAKANKENIEIFQRKAEEIRNKIKCLQQQINEHLDTLVKDLTQELASLEKEHIPKMENNSDTIKGDDKRVENALAVLGACTEFGSNEQLLVETERLRAQRDEVTAILKKNEKTMKRINLAFEPNAELVKFTETIEKLGKMRIREGDLLSNKEVVHLQSAEPELISTVLTNSSLITGCYMVDSERLLIANQGGCSVDLYHINGTLLSTHPFGTRVWGVDMIDDTLGATTLSNEKKVAFFEIIGDKVSPKQSVDLGVEVLGIVHMNGKLYMGCEGKIKIVDIKGNTMEDIPQPEVGSIYQLASLEGKRLVYTDRSKVSCISLEGNSIFKYSSPELDGPDGIDTDSDGNIYVIGYRSRNVHQLTREGTFCRILLKNLPEGRIDALQFYERMNRLIFNTWGTVHIYEMKNKT